MHLTSGWHAQRFDHHLPLLAEVGLRAQDSQLYAQGDDFTHAAVEPGYQGTSALLDLWKGNAPWGYSHLSGWWLMKGDNMQGVVLWMRRPLGEGSTLAVNPETSQTVPVMHLGQVLMFLRKEHRGQGLVRQVVRQGLAPDLLIAARRARLNQRSFPVLCAQGAAARLLETCTYVPVDHSSGGSAHAWWWMHEEAKSAKRAGQSAHGEFALG